MPAEACRNSLGPRSLTNHGIPAAPLKLEALVTSHQGPEPLPDRSKRCLRPGLARGAFLVLPIRQVMEELPAVLTRGIYEWQHNLGKFWAELESGAVIHVVCKSRARRGGVRDHRGWLLPVRPPGTEPVRVSCNQATKRLGWLFDQVRDGVTFEIFDHVHRAVRGYLDWCPPACLPGEPAGSPSAAPGKAQSHALSFGCSRAASTGT